MSALKNCNPFPATPEPPRVQAIGGVGENGWHAWQLVPSLVHGRQARRARANGLKRSRRTGLPANRAPHTHKEPRRRPEASHRSNRENADSSRPEASLRRREGRETHRVPEPQAAHYPAIQPRGLALRRADRGASARPAWECGGDEGDRTLDLRIANATLSQLSYVPKRAANFNTGRSPAAIPRGYRRLAGFAGGAAAARKDHASMAIPAATIGRLSHWPMVRPSASRPRKLSGSRVNSTRKRNVP